MKHRPDAKQYRIFTPGEQRRRRREKKKINRNLDPLSCYPLSNSANDPWKNFLQEFEIKSLVDGTGHKSTGKPTDLPPRCFLTISVTFQPYQSNNGNIVVQILTPISLQNSYDSNISITILDRKFKKIFYSILLFPTKITLNSPLHIRFHRVRKNAVSIFFLFFFKIQSIYPKLDDTPNRGCCAFFERIISRGEESGGTPPNVLPLIQGCFPKGLKGVAVAPEIRQSKHGSRLPCRVRTRSPGHERDPRFG